MSARETDLISNHPTDINANAVKLFGSRNEVEAINQARFERLISAPKVYQCLDYLWWNKEQHMNLADKLSMVNGYCKALVSFANTMVPFVLLTISQEQHRYSPRLELKKGMAVILLANIDVQSGLVNGAQGTIQGFKPYVPEMMPRAMERGPDGKQRAGKNAAAGSGRWLVGDYAELRESHIREFINQAEQKEWPEVRFTNGQLVVIHADCVVTELGDSKPYTILSRTQIPLAAGYAITTHKSQVGHLSSI